MIKIIRDEQVKVVGYGFRQEMYFFRILSVEEQELLDNIGEIAYIKMLRRNSSGWKKYRHFKPPKG